MLIFRSESLNRDIDNFLAAEEREREKLPRCSECDNPIQDDYYYEINGENVCEECLNDNHRKRVEDYVE